MMKASKILVTGLVAIGLHVSAIAEVSQPAVVTPSTDLMVFNNNLDNADLSYAFADNQNLQVQVMTQQEMDETQGAFAPIIAYGIRMGIMETIGAGANVWNHYSNTGKFSWGAAGRGFVFGAIGGGAAKFLGGRGW